ncbi:MAG TPA: MFS transporter [Candidatus Elarobacter sp.]|nr:MFS transporter [Candidatus Elarobacter sp.]
MNGAALADPRRLGAFWFGIQAVWIAVLGVVLQERATVIGGQAVLQYAALAAAGAAIGGTVQVVARIFSDRALPVSGSRRAFYALGVVIAIPAVVVLPAVTSLGALWSAVVLLQIGMNVAGGPFQAVVSDYLPGDRVGRASAWMSIYQFSGNVAGIVLTTQLHGVALGAALALCLAGGWLMTELYLRARPPIAASAAAPLRLDANVRTVLASRAFINFGLYTLFGFLFFFVAESLGAPDPRTTTGILILAFTVAGIGGAAVAGRPADRLDKRLVVTIACPAIAIAVGAFAAAPTVAVALACAAASGFAWGAFFTADWSIAYAVLPRNAMARAMGVWNLALAIPAFAAPAVTGPLVAALDARRAGLGPRVALVCVIVEFAIGTAWLWRLRLAAAGD